MQNKKLNKQYSLKYKYNSVIGSQQVKANSLNSSMKWLQNPQTSSYENKKQKSWGYDSL